MKCRIGCAACCIAPSISSAIPGMPEGKPAGARCIQLTVDNKCAIFGSPQRPKVCASLQPSIEMCCHSNQDAMMRLSQWEKDTLPEQIPINAPQP